MIIRERDISDSNGSYILKYTDYLHEQEMTFPECVIPVIYNKRNDMDLIQLEAFLQFGKYNNINDGTEAIARICEYHNIPINNIGFIVNEESIYENQDISDTYIQLIENNFPIFVAPISQHSIYFMKLNEALILDDQYGYIEECPHLIEYCTCPINESSMEETRKSLSKKLASIQKSIADKVTEFKNTSSKTVKATLGNQIEKLKSAAEFVKNKLSSLTS